MSVFRIDSPARDGMCGPLDHYPTDSGKSKLPSSAPRRFDSFAEWSASDRCLCIAARPRYRWLGVLKPRHSAPRVDLRPTFHDAKLGVLQMLDKRLGDDLRSDLVGRARLRALPSRRSAP